MLFHLYCLVWCGDSPTQLHLRCIENTFSICASTSVLKFSSDKHVFERPCFLVRHDWWLREDNVKFWLVLGSVMGTDLPFVVTFVCRQYRDLDSLWEILSVINLDSEPEKICHNLEFANHALYKDFIFVFDWLLEGEVWPITCLGFGSLVGVKLTFDKVVFVSWDDS